MEGWEGGVPACGVGESDENEKRENVVEMHRYFDGGVSRRWSSKNETTHEKRGRKG